MSLDFSRCRLAPFAHQREDTAWLIERPYALIASEMRTGKTKIVIDAAQFMHEAGLINRVIVIAPAPVRDVWYDPTLGELRKHLWAVSHHKVIEYHARTRLWTHGEGGGRQLEWLITNYEFLRSKARVEQMLPFCGPKTWLVMDESSFVKNHKAEQTKACLQLRRACGRVVLLNGTPIFHSPLDLFSQGNILHPSILECPFITYFKARYAIQEPVLTHGGKPLTKVMGRGKAAKEIIIQQTAGWTEAGIEDLQRRFAPYTRRRLQADCLDLPPKLDPVNLTVPLEASWPAYQAMRKELLIWLQSGQVAGAATAATKAMRLAQITSGFVGGVEDTGLDDGEAIDSLLESIDLGGLHGVSGQRGDAADGEDYGGDLSLSETGPSGPPAPVQPDLRGGAPRRLGGVIEELGREKLDLLLWFIEQRLVADPNLHLVVWGTHRYELFRMVKAVAEAYPQFTIGKIHGMQGRAERLAALALLKPETTPAGPVFVAGIIGTGSYGLDFTAAHTCVTISHDYSPGRMAQTLDRVYGPGQREPIAYFNIIATGPEGQKTIDHTILAARMAGESLASMTAAAWVRALEE